MKVQTTVTTPGFTPPATLDVLDSHGGFTALTRSGTLWRPGAVLKRGTTGTLDPATVNRSANWQGTSAISADYRLPGYGYRVRVWWMPDGQRLA